MSLVWVSEVLDKAVQRDRSDDLTRLSDVEENTIIEILGSIDQSNECLRMAEMGFTPNTRIKVIKNDGRNPLIIQTRNVKLMIARKLAQKILIA
ncbi:MAG: ferrous iron transport protein A [Candidatus Heimdallarchaeota archaeon]|nr:ferrous iron transport protein A [Candidatus Heimdallarchaeota archaeon]